MYSDDEIYDHAYGPSRATHVSDNLTLDMLFDGFAPVDRYEDDDGDITLDEGDLAVFTYFLETCDDLAPVDVFSFAHFDQHDMLVPD